MTDEDAGYRDRREAGRASAGFSMLDVLALPASERDVLQWLLRHGEAELSEIAAQTGQDEEAIRTVLDVLTRKTFLERIDQEGNPRWRARLALKQGRQVPRAIWNHLEE